MRPSGQVRTPLTSPPCPARVLPRHGLPGLALPGVAAPNLLDPRGPAAADIAVLWWVLLAVGGAVFVGVAVLLGVASVRRRTQDVAKDALTGEGFVGGGNVLVVVGGIAFPAAVVVGLMVATVVTAERVATVGNPAEPFVVEVTGHKFWWDVRYPDHGIRIANELHLPVGQPVEVVVTSADVIHSIWVPQLGGKIDMNPGHVNILRLVVDEPGEYRGLCTEFCGIQHARMHFVAVAHEQDDFARWLADHADPPDEPDDAGALAGRDVFIGAGCGECHTVTGVSPRNDSYPDLTFLAERRTIAAGILSNNRGTLGGWVLDPQGLKPGNRMPPANLTGQELQDLLDYLETLR
ncbi:MAG TPA: cytochrome c oxidase subunit II [Egibacteraceae bacterium]|jgi:cytochrome c oxidase subunit II|nr:cytochrome c oxidase subunit II [Egibacteraceae bacterium]